MFKGIKIDVKTTVSSKPAKPKQKMADSAGARQTSRLRPQRAMVMETIRQCAIEEFSQYGYRGSSTQGIADRAGLSKPQLHYYIIGKEELYEELLQIVVAERRVNLALEAAETDPRTALTNYVHKRVSYSMTHPDLSRIFTREIMDGGPYLAKYWPDAIRGLDENANVISKWVAKGLMKPVVPKLLLMSIWAMTQYHADCMVHTRAILELDEATSLNIDAIADEIAAMVLARCGLDFEKH